MLLPCVTFALTSGPGQPESKSFQLAGVSDMVDLSTGDLKYNIPLMDVDGYPINLNYKSGVGMDDEASWVGLGWNVNVGAINRQLRGIPDDFDGDKVHTEHYTKPKITVGGRGNAKVEVAGSSRVTPQLSFTLGIFSDNYTGLGAEVGANAGISYSFVNSGFLTAGMGVGVLSSTASGVDVSPNLSLSISSNKKEKYVASAGLSASLGYNSRSGLKSLSLGSSFTVSGRETVQKESRDAAGKVTVEDVERKGSAMGNIMSTAISYNTEPISPKISIPYKTTYESYSIDVGGVAWFVFGGGGLTGYRSKREVLHKDGFSSPGYGFLYAHKGKDRKDALMDFIREKDNPVIPEIPNLAVPVHTPDLFSYTSQSGGGQFRLYRDGTGVFFDNEVVDESSSVSIGTDAGIGAYAHGGVTVFDQDTYNRSGKWNNNNEYLTIGDFQKDDKPQYENVYFKVIGEQSAYMQGWKNNNYFGAEDPVSIKVEGTTARKAFEAKGEVSNEIVSAKKQPRRTSISYLTAAEASISGLEKTLVTYPFLNRSFDPQATLNSPNLSEPRVTSSESTKGRKANHLSEITVTESNGKRVIYGMPVYNLEQQDCSFAVDGANPVFKNLVQYTDQDLSKNNQRGLDNYFHKETQPAYASSYLITGILSPDYVDVGNDGISFDDDLGTAIKFNYSKISKFTWRAPFFKGADGGFNWANLNRGLLADNEDDRASVVTGEKEVCYLQSIESKTKIAFFITEDRFDGLGFDAATKGLDKVNRLKKLVEIRLYSKEDLSKPIRVVKFDYDYSLCHGTPNSETSLQNPSGGKLTLKKVWFEFAHSEKGKNHPYVFSYKRKLESETEITRYSVLSTDRWGTYKKANNPAGMENDEFPYTSQTKSTQDDLVSLWQLESIVLPSGGKISIEYESDDYAFVQNKKAMVMAPVNGFISKVNTMQEANSLDDVRGIKVEVVIPESEISDAYNPARSRSYFLNKFLNGSEYIYGKYNVMIANRNADYDDNSHSDFIPCHAKISGVTFRKENQKDVAYVEFEDLEEKGVSTNPVQMLAWQKMKNEYPKYSFPGYKNRVKSSDLSKTIKATINAIGSAFKNLDELRRNFYERARDDGFASSLNKNKCFVRIAAKDGIKLGGGLRVKKIRISDNWNSMSKNGAFEASYGQTYTYKTAEGTSSGVAAYEPSIGNDENPLKQPVPYIRNIKGALGDFLDLEEPFGESLFPAPEIVYSRVIVKDIDATGRENEPHYAPETGFIINEFFTAKDFPVKVSYTSPYSQEARPHSSFNFFSSSSKHTLTLSQGYSIILNDMHGKPRATRVFNKVGEEISSTVYHYNSGADGNGGRELKNIVKVIDPVTKQISEKTIGRDIEFFTDMREQLTLNVGNTINAGANLIPFMGIPVPVPHFPSPPNSDYMLFRSACALKVVQYYGVVDKVIKTEGGSSITTENLAFDAATGEALVTRTQDENDDYVYSVNMPAYWVYNGMGGAYKNQGTIFSEITTSTDGTVNQLLNDMLLPGDVILGSTTDNTDLYWVVGGTGPGYKPSSSYFLIDRNGLRFKGKLKNAKVVRSGYRNNLDKYCFNYVCQVNPISTGYLSTVYIADLKLLDASATRFSQEWANAFAHNKSIATPPSGTYVQPVLEMRQGNGKWDGIVLNGSNVGFMNAPQGNSALRDRRLYTALWYRNANNVVIKGSFYAPQNKVYFVGYAGASYVEVKIDGGVSTGAPELTAKRYFVSKQGYPTFLHIDGVNLAAGNHTIELIAHGIANDGALTLEVYNYETESHDQLINNTDPSKIKTLFTNHVLSPSSMQVIVNGLDYGDATIKYFTNPYQMGLWGNWRTVENKVWLGKRVSEGDKISRSGYFDKTGYKPFYMYSNNGLEENRDTQGWVSTSSVTLYDAYGNELENKDPLDRYSSARFIYKGLLASAVASNAEYHEIYNCSFEDFVSKLYYKGGTGDGPDFTSDLYPAANPYAYYLAPYKADTYSHSGTYSFPITATKPLTMSTVINKRRVNNIVEQNEYGEYLVKRDLKVVNRGFEPYGNKPYLFSVWVKDFCSPNAVAEVPVNLTINTYSGSSQVQLKCIARVEGWKLLSGEFSINALEGQSIALQVTKASQKDVVYIDDVSIYPKGALLKSFAYDSRTYKLMAELDENNFATFYEYDDEGSLVRVKKETHRGIATLKENYWSQYKHY